MSMHPIPAAEHVGHNYANGYPPPAPKQPRTVRTWLAAALIVAAAFGGAALGTANRPAPETVTVTKEVKVFQTPPACITALDLNEAAFGYASDALKAIMAGDYTASGEASSKINDIAPQVNQAKSDCRAANQ
jgi:hypothetical protein